MKSMRQTGASRARQRAIPSVVLTGVLALVTLMIAGCGNADPPIHRTGPIWTPSGSPTAVSLQDGSWPGFDVDAARSGINPDEKALTPTTVRGLRRFWSVSLPAVADSTPVLIPHLNLPNGTQRDVLYLTTKPGSLVALDASTGEQLWVANTQGPRYTTSSPLADAVRGNP